MVMKLSRIPLIALAAASAFAQQQTPVYSTSTFFHVEDGKTQAFIQYSKANTMKMMQRALDEDPALRSVLLTQVVYGGNPEPRGNFVLTTVREGSPRPCATPSRRRHSE